MSERAGLLAAILGSIVGGTAAAVTRFVIDAVDPVTVATFRFGIGFVLLLPLALLMAKRWPKGRDLAAVALLGTFFFAGFFILYNLALSYTSAARGSLALSTLPLQTMLAGAALGVERLTLRKSLGVLIAMAGVAVALGTGLTTAPEGAARGDLIMLVGTFCMALYNVWSRPFIARSGPLAYVTVGMGCGALILVAVSAAIGGFDAARDFGPAQWAAVLYLGAFGGGAAFFLWVFALERTTPTRVANTMTLNPLSASLLALVLVHEPIGLSLVIGLIGVGVGIWLASTESGAAKRA